MSGTALIAGVSGIVGNNLAEHLVSTGSTVLGLARRPTSDLANLEPIAADLLDPESLRRALAGHRPSHVYVTTWMRHETEAENIEVNGAMVRNLLDAVRPAQSVQHVALVTGLKHYLGPFELWGKQQELPATPFREEQGRIDLPNFYYAQEDEVFAAAERDGFGWSVHRPNTIIGYALGNAMNMGVTLAIYATLCRETGRPFRFPGNALQWNGLNDVTDARLLARHMAWAATTPAARNEAFNIVNGDIFRWNWLWGRIANWFGLEPAPFDGTVQPLEAQMAHDGATWAAIADKHGLVERDIGRLASAWHTDGDLSRTIEVQADMGKSRRLGFLNYQATDETFFSLFDRLRSGKVIP